MIESDDNGKKFAALLQASPLAIIELDRAGMVMLWNPAAEHIYGWSAVEAVGRRYCDLVVPEDGRPDFEAVHAQALAGAVTERVATRRRKDGRLIEVNASIAALRNDQDEPTSVLVIFSDVTEHQQAGRVLKKVHDDLKLNAEHLETLIDNIYDMILIVSDMGRILYASTSIERVAGYEAVSAESADVFEYVHPDDLEKIRKVLHFLLVNPGDVARTSGRFRHRNGHWIDMAITAHFAPSLGGVVVNARDETWRAQADAALKASERKFRGIVEHIQDGVTLIGETGAVVEWNRGMECITGLTRDNALGRLIWDIQYDLTPVERKAPDTLEILRDLARGTLLTGCTPLLPGQFEETILQRPGGERRFVEASLAPIATDRGFMLASIVRDVTERRPLQEEMERRVAQHSAELAH